MTEHSLLTSERLIDGILLDTCRAQNMFKIPLTTAGLSIMGECNKIAREYHDATSALHRGAATSESWVTGAGQTPGILSIAMAQRPGPEWEAIVDVVVCCFDNLSMKIDYKSYCSEGETGRKLDMTTWFSTRLPQYLAPTLDAAAICAPLAISNALACVVPMHCSHLWCASLAQFAKVSFVTTSRCAVLDAFST